MKLDLRKELEEKRIEAILHQRAIQLSQAESDVQKKEELRLLEFRLLGERWALDIRYVKEVFRPEGITPVPGSSSYIAGITNLRGNLLSVINTKELFALPSSSSEKEKKIIVIEIDFKEFGFLVDEVLGVVDLPLDSIEPPLSTMEKVKEKYIQGEVQFGHHLVGILNTKNIFGVLENVS